MSGNVPVTPTTEVELVARDLAIQRDLSLRGQRQINRIWEVTQAFVAASVTLVALASAVGLTPVEGSDLVGNAFFLVIGFYFGRTNHNRPFNTSSALEIKP